MHDVISVLSHYKLLQENSVDVSVDALKIICPFHGENVPSFNINLGSGTCFCFGCGWHGSIYDLVAKLEKTDTLHAMMKANEIAKYEQPKEIARPSKGQLLEAAWICYYTSTKPKWQSMPDHYLLTRGFMPETLEHFDVRIDEGSSTHPLVFPVYENNVFRGFQRRRDDTIEEKKYICSRGFSKKTNFFGSIGPGPVMVVEGILDAMKAWQLGFPNVCCIFGWKISDRQAGKISKYTDTVISALDNTPLGRKGTRLLRAYFTNVVRFMYPESIKDIGDMEIHNFTKSVLDTKEMLGG